MLCSRYPSLTTVREHTHAQTPIDPSTRIYTYAHIAIFIGQAALTFLPYYYSDLEPIAGCCRLCDHVSFHRGLQVSIDGHPRRQFRDIRHVFISHSSTFLSVCGTWIYRLLPALHAHLPCTTLLNSEERA